MPTPEGGTTARTLPYPVGYPMNWERAVEQRTRSATGEPGPDYWQQWTDYHLRARVLTDEKRLEGRAKIVYHNNSPDTLPVLFLHLNQNLHRGGVPRLIFEEVTGGIELERVVVDGQQLQSGAGQGPRYDVEGTRMGVLLPQPLAPGASVELEIDWSFVIPQAGASSRMGWDADNLVYVAYWYPQMAVYDDVVGWQADWFMGRAEFYMGYANYDVTVEAPEDWIVMATGALQNRDQVLAPRIAERLRRAESSDDVVHVITSDDFGSATRSAADGWHAWRFVADSVRDVAFSVTRESNWDAARTPVGDRDGDGQLDFARVDAIYRELAPRWVNSARYSQHVIAFLSRYTGFPYPWPHMTAVEGANIIGGGMEFPMMTLIGSYNQSSDSALYYVTAHEEAHMWFPMIVGSDERRRAWMDEGSATFAENQASNEFFPGVPFEIFDMFGYLSMARSGGEGEIMRWSDHHNTGSAYGVASYAKPATVLHALRGLLGVETFNRALQTYVNAWAFKHPYPWDLFNTFERVSGRDLDWFWRSWYYETWTLDQAVASVTTSDDGTLIVIEDRGRIAMPALVRVTRADGEQLELSVPVETWLAGARSARLSLPPGAAITRVEIDPAFLFPDYDRRNNAWTP
jgi:hypothetical protein